MKNIILSICLVLFWSVFGLLSSSRDRKVEKSCSEDGWGKKDIKKDKGSGEAAEIYSSFNGIAISMSHQTTNRGLMLDWQEESNWWSQTEKKRQKIMKDGSKKSKATIGWVQVFSNLLYSSLIWSRTILCDAAKIKFLAHVSKSDKLANGSIMIGDWFSLSRILIHKNSISHLEYLQYW